VRAKSVPSQREGAPLETLPSKVASRWFEFVDLEAIRANPNNAREHDTRQIAKLAQSIAKFGFLSPVVIDGSCELLCGHARYEAARQLGMKKIPAVRVTDLSEPQKRAFMLADNRRLSSPRKRPSDARPPSRLIPITSMPLSGVGRLIPVSVQSALAPA
jgi:hypothetical protein